MNQVITIKAFSDNYIYLYQYDQKNAIAIDPGDCAPVLQTLKKLNLPLTAILATHHHWDHIGGASELKKRTGCKIIGGDAKRISAIDNFVEDGQILTFGNITIKVIAAPGHTSTSVCYYIPGNEQNKNGILFTGDTLFIGGCGRLLECNARTMRESLQKLASLPDETKVYCGHEYTLENYEFALQIEPNNPLILERIAEITQTIKQSGSTIPSTISQEKAANIFLRADSAEVFAKLRHRKDAY
jgi:hydroxyacylglutathione hydrolase